MEYLVSTLRKFKCSFLNLKESTVQSIRQKYEEEIQKALKRKCDPMTVLNQAPRGRRFMLEKLDKMFQDHLRAVRRRGGVLSKSVAIFVLKNTYLIVTQK